MLRYIARITFIGFVRDRVLWAVLATGLLMFAVVPVASILSMRQVQELSITLSLSTASFFLLILTVLVGSSSIWRDIERRYVFSVLGLPLHRGEYVIGKFCGMLLLLLCSGLFFVFVTMIVVPLTASTYPSQLPIRYDLIFMASLFDVLKFTLLAGFALLFSSISTSFFLPVFGTVAVYFAGSASQEVMDYLSTDAATKLSPMVQSAAKLFYYVVPNFALFDLKVFAVYALPVDWGQIAMTLVYLVVYLLILLVASVTIFERREML